MRKYEGDDAEARPLQRGGGSLAIEGEDTVVRDDRRRLCVHDPGSVKITTFYQEGGNPEFDSGIKEWMNANPDALTNNGGNDMVSAVTAMGYDAYFTALEAIKAAGSAESADVLAALPSVSYEGVSGLIEFDEIGDAKRDAAYIKTANTETGEWEFVTVQGVE